MRIFAAVTTVVTLAGCPVPLLAQVTQTYQYDANGRLTGVSTVGSAGTNTASYSYDDVDNRTSRSQSGTSAYAALLSLPLDQSLRPNQAIVSPDGRYSLALRPSGSLELWAEQAAPIVPASSFAALFLVDDAGGARFQPRLSQARSGAFLALSNEGDLLVMAEEGAAVLWRAGSAQAEQVSQ